VQGSRRQKAGSRKLEAENWKQKVGSRMWQQAAAICALLLSSVRGVSISKESASASVSVQVGQEFLLDCDFSFDKEEEEELVVKWFFNSSTTPFYQWVPALDVGPQVILREAPGEIDINYSVEGEESFTKHRTLRIAEATLAHIGAYTCQVSSFSHEVSSTIDVAVYVTPSSLVLTSTTSATDNLISLTCVATDAFPAPILSLAWTESLVARDGETFSTSSENKDGLFTSSTTMSIKRDLVGKEDLAVCTLEIPGFDIHMTDEIPLLEEQIPEVYMKMFENKEQSGVEVAMAWEEEEKAEESALQRQQDHTVDDDDDNKDGENEDSEEDEEKSSATRSSTFVSSLVFFSALVCLI